MNFLSQPWPWYATGPLIGLTVPLLLLIGNKNLGVSSTLRQICVACMPAPTSFFDWKKDSWNLFFVFGMVVGGFLGGIIFSNPQAVSISTSTLRYFQAHAITEFSGMMPSQLFNWHTLLTLKGFLMMAVGGFLVGFGTRYAGGCTSGHGILGLSALQWPSLVATASFFAGGILFSKFILPFILSL